jgi:hypothetical protein
MKVIERITGNLGAVVLVMIVLGYFLAVIVFQKVGPPASVLNPDSKEIIVSGEGAWSR